MRKPFLHLLTSLLLLTSAAFAQDNPVVLNRLAERSIQLSSTVKLAYVEQGAATGLPVIFLHGFTDSWHSYESTLPYLPASIHAFAITQRGHGSSSRPISGYHPKDFAADVAAFINKKKLGPVLIVGHSMGGLVAQQFALDYPSLTKGLVIICSDAAFRDNLGLPEFKQEISQLKDPISYAYADAFQRSTITRPIDSAYYRLLVTESTKVPVRVWRAAIDGVMSVDYTARLAEIKKPVLIIWGDQDSYCPRTAQEQFVKHLPNARLLIYEGAGHALQWEDPKRVAGDLLNFIDQSIK